MLCDASQSIRLSWLRKQPSKFLVGSSLGALHLCEVNGVDGASEGGSGGGGSGLAARRIVRQYDDVRSSCQRGACLNPINY